MTVSDLLDTLRGRGFLIAPSADWGTLLVTPPPGGTLTPEENVMLRVRKLELLALFWMTGPAPKCPFPPDEYRARKKGEV